MVIVQWERTFGRFFLGILVLALLSPLAHAAASSINITPVNNEIYPNQSASYDVTIVNFGGETADYLLYTLDPNWNIKTTPLDLTVAPKNATTFRLFLRPSTTAGFGTLGVSVSFKDLTSGTVTQKTIVLSLRNPAGTPAGEYAPTVAIENVVILQNETTLYEIDPRKPISLRLELHNRNPLNISNLSIVITSPHFAVNTAINLAPLSVKTKDISGIAIDPLTPPVEGEVLVQLLYNGGVVNQLTKNYKIKEYTEIKKLVSEQQFLFKTERTVTITNDGNVQNTAIVTIPTSLLKNLFIGSSIQYETEVVDGQRMVVWSIPLGPSETKALTYTENYRILVLLAILAVIAAVAYFILRSPVTAVKEAVAIAHGGGVSDIKVRIFVRNRSAKIIQTILLTDKVPSLADVHKTDTPGNTPPSKIATNEKQGTLLRWDFDVLEPYEERVVTYQLKSKLKIIGRMKLPNARVKFTAKGRERVIYSNNIELIERFRDQ